MISMEFLINFELLIDLKEKPFFKTFIVPANIYLFKVIIETLEKDVKYAQS